MEEKRNNEIEKEQAKENKDFWINKGKQIIYPELFVKWMECVDSRINDLYYGKDLSAALDIMEALENDNFDEALKIFNDINEGMKSTIISSIVLEFSKKGPEFYEYVCKNIYKQEIPAEMQEFINKIREENSTYEKINNYVEKK